MSLTNILKGGGENRSILSGVIRNPDYQIFFHLLVVLGIGSSAYWLATRSILLWSVISVVIPLLLLIVHFLIRPVFVSVFNQRKIILVKYCTFVLQNAAIIFCYFYYPQYLSDLCLWILRINVFEVLVSFFEHKEYALCIPTLFLLFGTRLTFVPDPVHLMSIAKTNWFFIIEYTLWFISWIATCYPERFAISIHTIYPLFFPPNLWFSVRTLTGMVALYDTYLPPMFNNVLNSEKDQKRISTFGKIYKQVYFVLFFALYVYRFFYMV